MRLQLLAPVLFAAVGCAGGLARGSDGAAACRPPSSTDARHLRISADGAPGRYAFTVHSLGPEHRDQSVTGILQLWATSSADSSPSTGKRAAAGDTVRIPLFGATNLDLYRFRVGEPSDEASLRERTDPVFPQVMATTTGGVIDGQAWSTFTFWVGSVVNRRDGVMALDGAGHHFTIFERDATGFRGTFGPAGIVQTESGYFCARRIG